MRPDELPARLAQIEAQGLYRRRLVLEKRLGPEFECEGRRLLNFCSNDYLGLSDHREVIKAMQTAAEAYGVGSGASHLVSGHGPAHQALEEALAEFTGRERALLFSTGYMANLGVITALAERGDWVFEDRLNHASLLDGARLSGARLKRYAHGDMDRLCADLAQCPARGRLLVTDGVFSMDGDLAPLPELAALAREANAWLMVDDAHGLGVIGPSGRGVVEHHGLGPEDVPVLMGTLGKAFGTFGAFVAGSHDLIEYLIQRARPYIYTTALPAAVAEATRVSLALAREESWRRDRLAALIGRFRSRALQSGLPLMESNTPIQPILIGDNEAALGASRALLEAGFLVVAIRPPAVPVGGARLRVTLSTVHEESQVDRLLEALARIIPAAP
ncbi:MAG: 8-amino-7-oxononanoate synthase [Methylococcaceae bacterium]|nr:8-amino-7-oxononanoate synthase [Methylococcaceae bacterium]